MFEIKKLKPNPNNPRDISNSALEDLKESIESFPKMMVVEPIIYDENFVILAGHQRVKALEELGYKTIPDDWVKCFKDFTEKEKAEFVAKHNTHWGDWNFEKFKTKYWQEFPFEDWINYTHYSESEENDYADKNKEIDVSSFNDEYKIVIKFTQEEYEQIKEILDEIASNPKKALYQLLNETGRLDE